MATRGGGALIPSCDLQVYQEIERGSEGVVYRGTLRGVTPVALKTLHLIQDPLVYGDDVDPREGVNALMTEAGVLERIRHPNIPQYLGVAEGRDGRAAFIVMELAQQSLLQWLNTQALAGPGIPLFVLRQHALELLSAIAALHAMSPARVHTDVKPSNILLFPRPGGGHVWKLGDVGSSVTGSEQPRSRSAYYAAPEHTGDATITPEADVYSFGVVMAQVIAMRFGKVGGRVRDVIASFPIPAQVDLVTHATATLARACPNFARVLERCCSVDPSARITAKDALKELRDMVIEGYPPPHPRHVKKDSTTGCMVNRDGSVALCRGSECGVALMAGVCADQRLLLCGECVVPVQPKRAPGASPEKTTQPPVPINIPGSSPPVPSPLPKPPSLDAVPSSGPCDGSSVSASVPDECGSKHDDDDVQHSSMSPPSASRYEYRGREGAVFVVMGDRSEEIAKCHKCGCFLTGENVPKTVVSLAVAPVPYCAACHKRPRQVLPARTDIVFDSAACAVLSADTRTVASCDVCGCSLDGAHVSAAIHGPGTLKLCLLHTKPPRHKFEEGRVVVIKTGHVATCMVKDCGMVLEGDAIDAAAQAVVCRANCTKHYVRFDTSTLSVVTSSGAVAVCAKRECGLPLDTSHIDVHVQQLSTKPFCSSHYERSREVDLRFDPAACAIVTKSTRAIASCVSCRKPLRGDAIDPSAQAARMKPFCKDHYTASPPVSPSVSPRTVSTATRSVTSETSTASPRAARTRSSWHVPVPMHAHPHPHAQTVYYAHPPSPYMMPHAYYGGGWYGTVAPPLPPGPPRR